MDSTKTDSKWEKEFEEKFGEPPMDRFGKFNWRMSDLKTFIATTTKQAVEEERERIGKIIDELTEKQKRDSVKNILGNLKSNLLTKGEDAEE